MLLELRVKDLTLIDAATLEFSPGLTVLTGETGAGKTALLNSLKLLVGERADSSLVRSGAQEARIEALFTARAPRVFVATTDADTAPVASATAIGSDKTAPAASDTDTAPTSTGFDDNNALSDAAPTQEYLALRRIATDGRSRSYLNDDLVTLKTLSRSIGPLIDLYGQHEHQSLLATANQLTALDDFGGLQLTKARDAYEKCYQAYGQAARSLQDMQTAAARISVEVEQAAFTVKEIDRIDPQLGEYQALQDALPVLQNGEELSRVSQLALDMLHGDGMARDTLSAAATQLWALRGVDSALDDLAGQLDGIVADTDELTHDLRAYHETVEFDPDALQATMDRLAQLEGLSRRFGPGLEQVLQRRQNAQQLLENANNSDEQLRLATDDLATRRADLESAAATLTHARAALADDFTTQLSATVAHLAMPKAAFRFSVTDLDIDAWTLQGPQSFELLYQPDPTSDFRPLAKIASGGELSRVMLALKSMQQKDESDTTLVFDEIDAGIGGQTAITVATHLQALAQHNQVIVITHLAQIAAVATDHFVVSRAETKTGLTTSINRVEGKDRVRELARMLSGSTDDVAMEHAQRLLDDAQRATIFAGERS
ncbi:MAG: DNA repair protein RecN [Coriobacteriales bacterium]|jgi:DNA repair protein RecN (Recombination protein N)|nr:DNA repair protein RecN [Coriobacteriales bacterium]